MNCTESQELLQSRLDGEGLPDRTALERHLAGCADCRTLHAAAARLEQGLQIMRLAPPTMLSQTILAAVHDDRRQRTRRRWFAYGSLAAGLLLTVGMASSGENSWVARTYQGWLTASVPPTVPVPPTEPIAVPEQTPSLRASMADASSAVAALTRRTRDETVQQTRLITETLPAAVPPNVKDALPAEPPMPAVLQETGQRVSSGFEPVTNSARRAFKMFLREAPGSPMK